LANCKNIIRRKKNRIWSLRWN